MIGEKSGPLFTSAMTIRVAGGGDMNDMICIGHRGACGYEPENTLSSFAKAMEMGCPWIELDVYLVEGELLVIHDDRLERTTNGVGNVTGSSLHYLRSLDAGKGQQIPTLTEVAALVEGRCGINVELKGPDTAVAVSRLLVSLCEAGWEPERFLLSSFNHRELALADPVFPRGALFHKSVPDMFERTAALNATCLNLSRKLVKRELVDEAHDRDLRVFVYTVNEYPDIDRMRELGVDGVFSDYPDRVLDSAVPAPA